ncbi:unnamed protein product [Clonostachys rosea]|uniref:Ankyrin repeat protein n=1 Tax=Bionectria ochroleuca TaxID=29856 RepID=A0ABY6UD03_BIOOC|nr:unnamed protein product [Clonostachys rosea]
MSPKKTTGSEPKREAAGPVSSESLAAESYREGGAFASNVGAQPEGFEKSNLKKKSESKKQESKKSESRKLDAAPGEGYRKGPQDESYENPNARNTGTSENRPESYAGEAPSYVNSQYVDTHGPKGKNLHEGFDDSGTKDGIQAAMKAKIGSKDDPSRLAESKFELRNNTNPRAAKEGKLSTETNPTDGRRLCPPPIWIASFCGHFTMLDLFQGPILSKAPYTFSDDQSYYDWAEENTTDVVKGAIASGNLSQDPVPATKRGGQVRRRRQPRDGAPAYQRQHNGRLWGVCEAWNPLYRACQGGYKDTFEFLLDRNDNYNGDALYKAIRVGSLKILERLPDYDATVHNGEDSLHREVLSEIIRAQNTAMLDLGLERDYRITKERHGDTTKSAIANDLESMVEFLERIKIDE